MEADPRIKHWMNHDIVTARSPISRPNDVLRAEAAVVSGRAAKQVALRIKSQLKHPVWHAYCMYSDKENMQKQWIQCDASEYLIEWFDNQGDQLRGVESSQRWLLDRCRSGYISHIMNTMRVAHGCDHLSRWGIVTDLEPYMLAEVGWEAHIAQQDALSGYVGDMCLGICHSRFIWGLDFLASWPKRRVLLAADAPDAATALVEFRRYIKADERMLGSSSEVAQFEAEVSHMRRAAVDQVRHVLEERRWELDEARQFALRRAKRIMSTWVLELARRRQNTGVRGAATHTVSNDTA